MCRLPPIFLGFPGSEAGSWTGWQKPGLPFEAMTSEPFHGWHVWTRRMCDCWRVTAWAATREDAEEKAAQIASTFPGKGPISKIVLPVGEHPLRLDHPIC